MDRAIGWLSYAGARGAGLSQGLANKSIQIIFIRIVGAGLGLAAQVFASRIMGAEEFGRYALVLVYLLMLGHFGTFGTAQLLCRLLAEYRELNEPQKAAGLLRFAFFSTIGVSLLLMGLAIGIAHSPLLPIETHYVQLVSLALAGIPLLALQDFLEAISRGLDRPMLGIGPAFILRHLSIIFGLIGFVLLGHGASATSVMMLTLMGFLASIGVQYWLLRRSIREVIGDARPHYLVGNWIRTALPIAAVDVAEVLFLNADILILGLFVPPEVVALYFAASRLAQILAYVPYGVTAASAQKYAALFAASRHDQLQDLISKSALLSFSAALCGAVTISLLGTFLLGLFGPEFIVGFYLVPMLCSGIVVACMLGPGEDVLTMLGEERLCSLSFVLALAINIGTAFALTPLLGPLGAALATLAGFTARGVLLATFAYRRLGLVLPVFAGGSVFSRKELRP